MKKTNKTMTESSTTVGVPVVLPPKSQPFEVAVARQLKNRYKTLMDTFLKLDMDGDGYVTRNDLKKSLHNILGIDLTREQMDIIFTRFAYFDTNMIDDNMPLLSPLKSSGKHHGIRYADFVKYIHDTALDSSSSNEYGSALSLHATNDDHIQSITHTKNEVTMQLRQALERKLMEHSSNSKRNGIDANAQIFLEMDTDRSGKVTPTQFREWLTSVGLELSDKQCQIIFGKHYHENKGFDLNEFIQVIEHLTTTTDPSSSSSSTATTTTTTNNNESNSTSTMTWDSKDTQHLRGRKYIPQEDTKNNKNNTTVEASTISAVSTKLMTDAVHKLCVDDKRTDQDLVHNLAQQIFTKRYTMLKAFDKFDQDRDGQITAQELYNVLKDTMKLDVSKERVLKLIQKFDHNNDNKLNKSDFVSMISSNARTTMENETTNTTNVRSNTANSSSSNNNNTNTDVVVQMKRLSLVDDKVGHEEEEQQKDMVSKLNSDDIDIILEFRRACQNEMLLASKCFQKLDKDKSWTLSIDELLEGFNKLGIQNVTKEQMKHIISRFDNGKDTEQLNYVQFIQLLAAQLDTL